MKNIDDIVFTDEILEKYKNDSKMITELCKKLDENQKVQEEYKKFLKGEERFLHAYEKLQQENKQLKDNWNKLKEWVKEQPIFNYLAPVDIKNKMQKLQGSDSNE